MVVVEGGEGGEGGKRGGDRDLFASAIGTVPRRSVAVSPAICESTGRVSVKVAAAEVWNLSEAGVPPRKTLLALRSAFASAAAADEAIADDVAVGGVGCRRSVMHSLYNTKLQHLGALLALY